MLKEDPCPAEAHSLLRQILIEKALSPVSSTGLIDRADGTKEVVYEEMPMWHSEDHEVPADYDDEKGKVIVEKAFRGDADAGAALCEIAVRHIALQKPLPMHLGSYIVALLRRQFKAPPKRGKGRYSAHQNTIRDYVIVYIVASLQKMGIPPTRSRANHGSDSKKASGCSIVVAALAKTGVHIDETGVEKVWQKRRSELRHYS
jgi:hypothetical protein